MSLGHLWTFRRCPYAIRARLALDTANIQVPEREILLRDKPEEMLAESPKGTVPVLVLADGTVIEESFLIMKWALSVSDPEDWLPQSSQEQERVDIWGAKNDTFKPSLDRYKYSDRFSPESRLQAEDLCRGYLSEVNTQLTDSAFLLGNRFSLVDAALLPFVRQFHFCDVERLDRWKLGAVSCWLSDFLESPRFSRVMAKHPVWSALVE